MSHVLRAFGLLDFTTLWPILTCRAFWNLWTIYFFKFPIQGSTCTSIFAYSPFSVFIMAYSKTALCWTDSGKNNWSAGLNKIFNNKQGGGGSNHDIIFKFSCLGIQCFGRSKSISVCTFKNHYTCKHKHNGFLLTLLTELPTWPDSLLKTLMKQLYLLQVNVLSPSSKWLKWFRKTTKWWNGTKYVIYTESLCQFGQSQFRKGGKYILPKHRII